MIIEKEISIGVLSFLLEIHYKSYVTSKLFYYRAQKYDEREEEPCSKMQAFLCHRIDAELSTACL